MHTPPTWVLTLVAVTLVSGLAGPAFAAAPKAAANDTIPTVEQPKEETGSKPQDTAAIKAQRERALQEIRRRKEIAKWASDTKANTTEEMKKIFAPTLKGNQQDLPLNTTLAARYTAAAQAAQKNKQSKAVSEKYLAIAKAYTEIAEQNDKIVKALEKLDLVTLAACFEPISKLEARITELAGKPPKRSWFMPSELTMPRGSGKLSGKSGLAPRRLPVRRPPATNPATIRKAVTPPAAAAEATTQPAAPTAAAP